ncbi:hypothetical protein [Taibaiella soli]|uniref:Uncharacterized protein n=1 Tax=Taibaiella soli TaxID=1649169 RepID=A0A2W2B592_9BACT|nr:hypothetical protein [Taibaiella soli]PZF71197.1 hypothetical protein DN068_19680 [Taibaiella soli]
MKALPQNSGSQPEWDSNLIKDLSFIKKNLRYPISKRQLLPGMLAVMSLTTVCLLVTLTLAKKHGPFDFLLVGLLLLTFFITSRRTYESLRFISVPTPFVLIENIKALHDFLESQHLVVFHHPEAPEVFQIISKNIDAFKDVREILVFIADDNRILINSHFTSVTQNMTKHHKQMGKMLTDYIKAHEAAGPSQFRQKIK